MVKFRNDLCLGKGFIVKYILLIFRIVLVWSKDMRKYLKFYIIYVIFVY